MSKKDFQKHLKICLCRNSVIIKMAAFYLFLYFWFWFWSEIWLEYVLKNFVRFTHNNLHYSAVTSYIIYCSVHALRYTTHAINVISTVMHRAQLEHEGRTSVTLSVIRHTDTLRGVTVARRAGWTTYAGDTVATGLTAYARRAGWTRRASSGLTRWAYRNQEKYCLRNNL